jgi:hypothetical protein
MASNSASLSASIPNCAIFSLGGSCPIRDSALIDRQLRRVISRKNKPGENNFREKSFTGM